MKTLVTLFVITALAAGRASALEIRTRGKEDDPRVRWVNYKPNQVYQLTGFYGYHTTISFSKDEIVQIVTSGFASAWEVSKHGWFVTVKPKDPAPETNLTITTNLRRYRFDLRAKHRAPNMSPKTYATDPDQIFELVFRYPEEERRFLDEVRAKVEFARQRREAEQKRLAEMPPRKMNREYSYQGPEAIAPYEAWDDGSFTYFRFYAQQDLPAVFVINDDGSESIANKHFERDVLVVQRVARQMRLRKGALVVCVYNENPQYRTAQPTTGATEPGAERIKRGG